MNLSQVRDHGGGLDAAVSRFGGARDGWIDLSTGINPVPFPLPEIPAQAWTALPDEAARDGLIHAARAFWKVPEGLDVLAVPGASAAIAHIPLLDKPALVLIPGPTYNEHAASFAAAGWQVTTDSSNVMASVHVHPNNPDGRLFDTLHLRGKLRVIDESFCDVTPERSLLRATDQEGALILKSFGKFWGLAGLRLGFVIAAPNLLSRLAEMLGPWPVAGPALHVGTLALQDHTWADITRVRLAQDAARLDALITRQGATLVGGTDLFRLYDVKDASAWQSRLAQHHIWSRVFPYNPKWLRLGLPHPTNWERLQAALA